MSKSVTFRFPEELLERVDQGARAFGGNRTAWAQWAFKAMLETQGLGPGPRVEDFPFQGVAKKVPPRSIPCEEVGEMGERAELLPNEAEARARGDFVHYPPPLCCPSSGCDFQAPSPNARCPKHGRRVR